MSIKSIDKVRVRKVKVDEGRGNVTIRYSGNFDGVYSGGGSRKEAARNAYASKLLAGQPAQRE